MASQDLQEAKRLAAGTSILSSQSSDAPQSPDTPDYRSEAYRCQLPRWCVMQDVLGGTDKLREKAATYLPKMPLEDPEDYKQRIKATEFFNATARTKRGLVGMVFRKPPTLGEDVGEQLAADWENIDGAGTHGEVFAREAFESGMALGHGAIFVDYPDIPEGTKPTLADEREQDIRPYWVHISADQIMSVRTESYNGRSTLSQIVIKECTLQPTGLFGEQYVEQYRVLRKGMYVPLDGGEPYDAVLWEVWRWTEQDGKGKQLVRSYGGKYQNMTRIPVTLFYCGEKKGSAYSCPPLLDLAYTNIAHWNVQSDHRHSLHKASIPLLTFIGRDTSQGTQPIGVNLGIDIPIGGDMKYVEHAGSALGATRQELQDLEQRMAALGLAMLQQETRAAETAEAKRIDKADQDSALSIAARSLQDALEEALSFHAEYLGALPEDGGGSVLVNRDYDDLQLDAGTIAAYSQLQIAGQIDLDTLWSMLEAGKVLPEDFSREAVRGAVMKEAADAAAQALAIAQAQGKDQFGDSGADQ